MKFSLQHYKAGFLGQCSHKFAKGDYLLLGFEYQKGVVRITYQNIFGDDFWAQFTMPGEGVARLKTLKDFSEGKLHGSQHDHILGLMESSLGLLHQTVAGSVVPTDPVRLLEAEALYQKVLGTSANSVYFCFLLGPEIKGAFRIHQKRLSVRVEGTFSAQDRAFLESMSMHSSTVEQHDYASMHVDLSAQPDHVVLRTLGSVGMALSGNFEVTDLALNAARIKETATG